MLRVKSVSAAFNLDSQLGLYVRLVSTSQCVRLAIEQLTFHQHRVWLNEVFRFTVIVHEFCADVKLRKC